MEYTALWGSKGFLVSPSKVVPLNNLTTSFSIKEDKGNDTNDSSSTNKKGLELQTVSLSTVYVRGAGVDPRGQISEWKNLVGKSYPLYIGGKRFGPKNLMLKSVNVSEVLLSNTGKFLKCAITLSFEESKKKSTIKKTTKIEGDSLAKTVYEALDATPSKDDKNAMKP